MMLLYNRLALIWHHSNLNAILEGFFFMINTRYDSAAINGYCYAGCSRKDIGRILN